MDLQKILGSVRRAVETYNMIEDSDRVGVGLSGGKDSLVLLKALSAYRRFSPAKFELFAYTIDLGLDGADYRSLVDFCAAENVPYRIERTDIGKIIFEVRREAHPCSLCSKMRRGALNSLLVGDGVNKLALGHHADDLAETFLLSAFYEGRLSTLAPINTMERTGVTLIRPLILTYEKNIAAYARAAELPVVKNPCPANHETQREYVKSLIKSVQKDIPIAKDRLVAAIINADRYNLWDKYPVFKARNDK